MNNTHNHTNGEKDAVIEAQEQSEQAKLELTEHVRFDVEDRNMSVAEKERYYKEKYHKR